jgi:LuxR family maltose regulon positive regulatory protein
MIDGDVRERSGRSYPRNGPVLDLVASKLRRPLARPGTVLRLPLVERLARSDLRPIVSVVAPLRTGRLRAEGRILEIGPADVSLTREEAAGLLREAGVVLGADEVTELHRRTEGWPTGLYLAALYLWEGGSLPGAAAAFGGDDRLVSEYVESEFLARIPERQRVFLTRTAVLDRVCGPLCEAVLERLVPART